jgi:hypothetical protein
VGGALSRAPEGAGALPLCRARSWLSRSASSRVRRPWGRRGPGWAAFKAALEPYDAGHYFNFVEESFDITQIFPPEVLSRLREVKQSVRPREPIPFQPPGHGLAVVEQQVTGNRQIGDLRCCIRAGFGSGEAGCMPGMLDVSDGLQLLESSPRPAGDGHEIERQCFGTAQSSTRPLLPQRSRSGENSSRS